MRSSPHPPSSAHVIAPTFRTAISHLEPGCRHLVLLDIDDNLMTTIGIDPLTQEPRSYSPRHPAPVIRSDHCGAGSDNWLKARLKQGRPFRTEIKLYDVLQARIQTQSVEPDKSYPNSLDKLEAFRQPGNIILGITSRAPRTAGSTEYQLRQCGFNFRDLHQFNLGTPHCDHQSFPWANPKTKEDEHKLLHHNIIYCEGRDKGSVLQTFLTSTRYGQTVSQKGFDRIFFMDDDNHKCTSIQQAAKALNKPVTTVHNTFVANNYTPWDQTANQESDNQLVEQHRALLSPLRPSGIHGFFHQHRHTLAAAICGTACAGALMIRRT